MRIQYRYIAVLLGIAGLMMLGSLWLINSSSELNIPQVTYQTSYDDVQNSLNDINSKVTPLPNLPPEAEVGMRYLGKSLVESTAEEVGLPEPDVREQFFNGTSLAEIAEMHNGDVDQIIQHALERVEQLLTADLEQNRMTEEVKLMALDLARSEAHDFMYDASPPPRPNKNGPPAIPPPPPPPTPERTQ